MVAAVRQLQANWNNLTVPERGAAIFDAANHELQAAGVPQYLDTAVEAMTPRGSATDCCRMCGKGSFRSRCGRLRATQRERRSLVAREILTCASCPRWRVFPSVAALPSASTTTNKAISCCGPAAGVGPPKLHSKSS